MGRFRALFVVGAFAGSLVVSPAARAGEKERCVQAHADGQRLDKRGELREAVTTFTACASPSCPRIVESECRELLARAKERLPTIVVEGRGSDGPILEARVLVDGRVVAERLDGAPLALNPGARIVRLEPFDRRYLPKEAEVTAREGERGARVVFELAMVATHDDGKVNGGETDVDCGGASAPPCNVGRACRAAGDCASGICEALVCRERPAPSVQLGPIGAPRKPEAKAGRGVSVAGVVLLGVAAAGVGTFAAFGLQGKADERELTRCAPRCNDEDVDRMVRNYAVADVGLAIGVVAGVVGGWLVVRELTREPVSAVAPGTLRWSFW